MLRGRDVAHGEDVGIAGAQGGVDLHAAVGHREPGPFGQFDVGLGAYRDKHRVGGDGRAVGQGQAGGVTVLDSDAVHLGFQSQIHAVVAVQVGEQGPDGFAECGQQRLLRGFHDGDGEVALSCAGRNLQADPAGTHHREGRTLGQDGIESDGVGVAAQVVHSGGISAGDRRPTRSRTGCQQELVVDQRRAVVEADGVRGDVQRFHLCVEPQVNMVRPVPVRVLHGEVGQRLLTGQEILRQRRTLVGQVFFLGEHHDPPVKALLAQSFHRLRRSQPSADDDECPRAGHDRSLLSTQHLGQ